MEIMRSLSEFMSNRVSDYIYEDEKSFLTFKHCKFISSADLNKLDNHAKVIFLCQESDIIFGPYLPFFTKFMQGHQKNSVIFIEKYPEGITRDDRTMSKVAGL